MKKKFNLSLDPRAHQDIQDGIDYYDGKRDGLGEQFFDAVDNTMKTIKMNPLSFQVRYDQVRCIMVKGFPYMVHYSVDETNASVYAHAIINTSKDPKTSWVK